METFLEILKTFAWGLIPVGLIAIAMVLLFLILHFCPWLLIVCLGLFLVFMLGLLIRSEFGSDHSDRYYY
jgi:hypothetical protein